MSVSGYGLNNIAERFLHVIVTKVNIPTGEGMNKFYHFGKPAVNTDTFY